MSKSQDQILMEWADLHDKNDALQAHLDQLLAAAKAALPGVRFACKPYVTEQLRAAIAAAESKEQVSA